MTNRGFTLVEILIVIGILAVIAVVVIIVLNPAELIKEAQDVQRISDLKTLDGALSHTIAFAALSSQSFDKDGPNFSGSCKGEASPRIFVSVPSDNGEISPAPPSQWVWQRVAKSDLRNTNGTGWLPVDFGQYSGSGYQPVIASLPVDPVNTFASGFYYTYVCGSYEINAALASKKYKNKLTTDGGDNANLFEMGTDFTLAPVLATQQNTGYVMGSGTPTSTPSANWIPPDNWFGDDISPTSTQLAQATTTNAVSPTVIFSGFNFGIPANSSIDKICLLVNNVSILNSQAGIQKWNVDLSWDGGTSLFTASNTLMADVTDMSPTGIESYFKDESTAPTSIDPGTSCTTWGHGWTPSEMSSSNFAVRLKYTNSAANTRQLRFDVIRVNVYYTPP